MSKEFPIGTPNISFSSGSDTNDTALTSQVLVDN